MNDVKKGRGYCILYVDLMLPYILMVWVSEVKLSVQSLTSGSSREKSPPFWFWGSLRVFFRVTSLFLLFFQLDGSVEKA